MAILSDLKDPQIRGVTVIRVEVSADLRIARIHVSVMGDEKQQQLSINGLKNAAGFLQSRISSRVDMRYTPKLEFILDQGVKRSIEIARLLKEVLPDTAETHDESESPLPGDGTSDASPADAPPVATDAAVANQPDSSSPPRSDTTDGHFPPTGRASSSTEDVGRNP